MGSQQIFFEHGALLTGDSDERGTSTAVDGGVTSIKPVVDGERAVGSVLDRPLENLRQRTEVLRGDAENGKYLDDSNMRFIISAGNAGGVGIAQPIPAITSWDSVTGKFVTSAPLVVQPLNTPSSDVRGSKLYIFDDGVSIGYIALLPLRSAPITAPEDKFAYNGANLIRIKWAVATSLELAGAVVPNLCDAAVSGDPDHILTITIRIDDVTTVDNIASALTAIQVGQLTPAGIDWGVLPVGTTVAKYSTIPAGDKDYFLKGTADRELHYITPAIFVTFFGSSHLEDGDTLSIYFPEMVESSGSDGRRQRTQGYRPLNTAVTAAELFITSNNPEYIPYAIPLCKRIGDDLLWLDGTIIRGTQSGTPIYFGENGDTVNRIAGHIASGGHADTVITTAAIAGSPESFAGGFVHGALAALYGHVNDRTERATAETVSGTWTFKNPLLTTSRTLEANNLKFKDNPFVKTLHGGSSSYYATPGSIAAQLCSTTGSWACPWTEPNSVSLGGTLALRDITMTYHPTEGDRRIVVADNTNFALYHFKAIGPTVVSPILLVSYFPVGSYSIDAICSDEKYVYVMVRNTGTKAHYINAIDLAGTARWAAATVLPGTGNSPFSPTLSGNVRVATMDSNNQYAATIVTLNNWQTDGSGLVLTKIDAADGTILISGEGDLSAVAVGPIVPGNVYPHGGLCSDGVNIYFTWKDTTPMVTASGVATAKISDLTDPGLVNMPKTNLSATSNYSCLQFDGDGIWAFEWDGDIWIYRWRDRDWYKKVGPGAGSYRFACFDGLNMWMQVREAAHDSIEVYKLPAAQNRALGSSNQTVVDMTRLIVGFMQEDEVNTVLPAYMGRMCFDGDAIWMIMDMGALQSMSGVVRCLPAAAMH